MARVLVIDNYDSFTYNLVQLIGAAGHEVEVHRNDAIDCEGIERRAPTHLVISPGPRTPREAGVSVEAVRRLGGRLPILGVCLGHQAIGAAFGGEVVRAGRLMHGKTSPIHHDGRGVYRGLPDPFEAARYHSLTVRPDRLPDCLEATAWTPEGELMGVRHRAWPVEGVQFHPESFMTPEGPRLVANFLMMEGTEVTR
ncbi:MAG: aminodeoxychorismate/anthranilate synthase component II [Planctomycetes bacterium]|nr:aminodeoxychorismate/anthranilate synthase component II [Planctomycetota bacterium]